MKNKISLLVSSAAICAFMACSSLDVSNPEQENFPEGWSVAEYISLNPTLRSLQIRDQVAIRNVRSGLASDEAAFVEDTATVVALAGKYAGFAAPTAIQVYGDKNTMTYLKGFNIYGETPKSNLLIMLDTLSLDSSAVAEQYIAFGRRDGLPYRLCREGEGLVQKGTCQAKEQAYEKNVVYYYDAHLYCSRDNVTYCIDCGADLECPVVDPVVTPESSAAAEPTPSSSETTAEPVETPVEPVETPAES